MDERLHTIHTILRDACFGAPVADSVALLKKVAALALEMQCRVRENHVLQEYKAKQASKGNRLGLHKSVKYERADGTFISVPEAAKLSGIPEHTIKNRIYKYGTSIDGAMSLPWGEVVPTLLRNSPSRKRVELWDGTVTIE